MRTDGFWNDQPGASALNYVIEWDSSLFISGGDADLAARAAEYSRQYLQLLEQIDMLAEDTHIRGIGLLQEEDLKTIFNADGSNFLITEGINASSAGLGLVNSNFLHLSTLNIAQEEVRQGRELLRAYSASLLVDFSIINIRVDFTRNTINTHKSGGNDLVLADQNQVGAEFLALQTRQQLEFESLRLSSQSNVNKLFS